MVPMSPLVDARKELVLYKEVEVPHNPAPVHVVEYYVDNKQHLTWHEVCYSISDGKIKILLGP